MTEALSQKPVIATSSAAPAHGVGNRSSLASSRLLLRVELDDDDRALRRGADVDDLATVLEDALLGHVQVAAEVQAGRDHLERVEEAALAAVSAGRA